MFVKVIAHLLAVAVGASACSGVRPSNAASAEPSRARTDEERRLIAVTAATLFDLAPAAVPVCVELADSLTRYGADRALVALLGPRARSRADCPRTYASMIFNPSEPLRPAGYVDPYILVLWWPVQTQHGSVIAAELWQGTGFTSYRCEVAPSGDASKAVCKETGRGVS